MKNNIKAGFNFILLIIYVVLSVYYLSWRITTSFQLNYWFIYPLLFSETYIIVTTFLHLLTTWRVPKVVPKKKLENVSVDIFIPTYNEPENVLKMTLLGALSVKGVENVFLLDDGNRAEIKKMTESLGAKYLARKEHLFAKAGNMNFGLLHSTSEYVVFFDSDHVPCYDFIEKTSGFFRDEKVAFVQTPQTFYNYESIEFRKIGLKKYWNEQSMFYESIQPAKNAYNAAFFCGSGAMLRRSALDSIGGFATGTATEDLHTSLKLHAKGWRSVYLNEVLAYGLAPSDLNEYHRQRVRWGAGSLGLLFRSPDSPLIARGLSLMQRICYFNSASSFLNGIFKLFFLITPVAIIISLPFHTYSGIPVYSYFKIFLPFMFYSYFVTFLFSKKTFHPLYTEQFNFANIFSNLESFKGILHVQKKFGVSLKTKTRKENPQSVYKIIVSIPIILFASNMFSLIYWFVIKSDTFISFSRDIVSVSFFWNSVNFIITSSFAYYLYSYNKKPTEDLPFLVNLNAYSFSDGLSLTITNIGLGGIKFVVDHKLDLKKNENSLGLRINENIGSLSFYLENVAFQGKISNGKYLYSGNLESSNINNDKNLVDFIINHYLPSLWGNGYKSVTEGSKLSEFAINPSLDHYSDKV